MSVGGDTSRFVITDTSGTFLFVGLAAGVQQVHFRRLGLVPADFTVLITAGEEMLVSVVLEQLPVRLESIEISRPFRPALALTGFYERRRQRELGILTGTFIDPEEIERRRASNVTYYLEGIPGLTIERNVPRGRAVGRDGRRCQMAVFVDGAELSVRDVEFVTINGLLSPFDIAAIEVYTSPSGTPNRFQTTRLNHPCGSIVIWTKSG